MSKPKEDRWYERDGEELRVFNSPDPSRASACSITGIADLPFYRRNFRLREVEVPLARGGGGFSTPGEQTLQPYLEAP